MPHHQITTTHLCTSKSNWVLRILSLNSLLLQLIDGSFWFKIFCKQRAGCVCQTDKLLVFLLQSNTWKKQGLFKSREGPTDFLKLLYTFSVKVRCITNQKMIEFVRTHRAKLLKTLIDKIHISVLSLLPQLAVTAINFHK